MHRDAATFPALHTGGGHGHLPFAIGTEDGLGVGSAAERLAVHRQHRVIILVEEGHLVIIAHHLTRFNTFNLVYDETVALNDDLTESSQWSACLSLGGIGPSKVTYQRNIAINTHLKVIRTLGHFIEDIVRNKIHHQALAAGILEVLTIDEEEAATRAAPTVVEVEQTVNVVAVANEGVPPVLAVTRVIQRNVLVDSGFQEGNPFLIGVVATP